MALVSTAITVPVTIDIPTTVSGGGGGLTQADADAQGMPSIEAGSVSAASPVRLVNATFTLLSPSIPANYWQSYYNIAAVTVTASAPSGYSIVGSPRIPADSSALFIKIAGASQFRRWS